MICEYNMLFDLVYYCDLYVCRVTLEVGHVTLYVGNVI